MAFQLHRRAPRCATAGLKNALRDGAVTQHLVSTIMQGEDAPQRRTASLSTPPCGTYSASPCRASPTRTTPSSWRRDACEPILKQVLDNAGADRVFLAPCDTLLRDPPDSRHVKGTLRMGTDPTTSVTNADGRFHDVDNLYACDGSVFPTSSGYNPTLTIIATALKIAHALAGTPPALGAP